MKSVWYVFVFMGEKRKRNGMKRHLRTNECFWAFLIYHYYLFKYGSFDFWIRVHRGRETIEKGKNLSYIIVNTEDIYYLCLLFQSISMWVWLSFSIFYSRFPCKFHYFLIILLFSLYFIIYTFIFIYLLFIYVQIQENSSLLKSLSCRYSFSSHTSCLFLVLLN